MYWSNGTRCLSKSYSRYCVIIPHTKTRWKTMRTPSPRELTSLQAITNTPMLQMPMTLLMKVTPSKPYNPPPTPPTPITSTQMIPTTLEHALKNSTSLHGETIHQTGRITIWGGRCIFKSVTLLSGPSPNHPPPNSSDQLDDSYAVAENSDTAENDTDAHETSSNTTAPMHPNPPLHAKKYFTRWEKTAGFRG